MSNTIEDETTVVGEIDDLRVGLMMTMLRTSLEKDLAREIQVHERYKRIYTMPKSVSRLCLGIMASSSMYIEIRYGLVRETAKESADIVNYIGDKLGIKHEFISSLYAIFGHESASEINAMVKNNTFPLISLTI